MKITEYKELIKKNKYGNTRVNFDGKTFDSQKEANRYSELKFLEKLGKIKNLELQPRFELQSSFRKNGQTYRSMVYIADFQYFDVDRNKIIIEDTKGFKTKEYLLKKKMFESRYPELEIEEI